MIWTLVKDSLPLYGKECLTRQTDALVLIGNGWNVMHSWSEIVLHYGDGAALDAAGGEDVPATHSG